MAGLSRRKISQYEKIVTPDSAYFKTLKREDQRYLRILSKDWPKWLDDYISTPEMKRLKFVGQLCGTDYTKLYRHHAFYSVLDHSVAAALIVWHFTGDKKQTLSALLHDISSPVFKHCVDFLNGDAATQESTEKKTKEFIGNSEKITKLLKRDKLRVRDVADYHLYPIADSDTPRLSADRLEYSFMNFHKGAYKTYFSLEDIERIYSDIEVGTDENGAIELAFRDLKIAEDFVLALSKSWSAWRDEKYRFTGNYIRELLEKLLESGKVTEKALYHLTEREVISLLEKSEETKDAWQRFKNLKTVKKAEKKPEKLAVLYKDQKIKLRFIDPLVRIEANFDVKSGAEEVCYARLSKVSPKVKRAISRLKSQKFAKYVYL